MIGNTFGKTGKNYSAGKNVWYEVTERMPVGATIAVGSGTSYTAGAVIPSGTLLNVNDVAHTCTVVSSAGTTENPSTFNAILENDIYVEEGDTVATATCVKGGVIYGSRMPVPIGQDQMSANLPKVTVYNEA